MISRNLFPLLPLLFNLLLISTSGKSSKVCISPGGRFPPFFSEGKPPRKAIKGPRDLTLCSVFRRRTCCDVAQTHPAFLSIRRLASAGEASQECLHLWELLECAICDPRVGVQPGPPIICTSFCDLVFQACASAYFSVDSKNHVLSPCGLNDIVCGRAAEWASNGTELCRLAGFSVIVPEESRNDNEEPFCYGGKASFGSIADSWKTSQPEVPRETESSILIEDFNEWVRDMPFSERVSWAVSGIVLTAGLMYIRKRKSHVHRNKQAAILRTARRLETRANPPTSIDQGNKKKLRR